MKPALIALLILAVALPAFAGGEAQAPRDMVVLNVSGLIGKTNRGKLDQKRDSLLALQKIDFKTAFAFDRAMLLKLPQGSVTAQPNEFDKPATFKGPLLREVLGFIEAAKVKVSFMAVDGYSGWLSPEDIETSDWILALEADGVPLGLGQQGPIWLINTRDPGFKPDDTHRGHWVWALFYMHIGEE
jgi:hypothetical protein